MAVDRVLAQPVAEAEEELHALVGMQLGNVLSGTFDRQRSAFTVAGENLVLLQVNVHRMGPISCEVGQEPLLHAVLLHREAEGLGEAAGANAAVHELAVDGPLAIQAVKLECADDPGLHVGAGELVEGGIGGRIHAVVADRGSTHPELQQEMALSGWQN